MTGSLFARTLKQDAELRHDFEAWIAELRGYASRILETAAADVAIFHAQGHIRQLDAMKVALEQMMNLPSEENGVSRHS